MVEQPELQYLYLTTTGRPTGLPREVEIWFTEHGGCYYVIAEHRERTHWVQNLLANPAVRVRVGDVTFTGRARVVDPSADPERVRQVRALSDKKYGWSDGLIVELTPASRARSR
jgi:deazaflavin-dependent oxidoreductase (nitroreductase family)